MTSLLQFIDPPAPFSRLNHGPLTALATVAAHLSLEEASDRLYRSPRTIGAQVDEAADVLAGFGVGDGSRPSAKRHALLHGLADVEITAIDPTAVRDPKGRTVITVTPDDRPLEPRRHAFAAVLLKTLGFDPVKVAGRWTSLEGRTMTEPGWQVVGMPDGYAIMLGNLFHQRCVLSNGMLYHLGSPSLGGTTWAQAAEGIIEYPPKHCPPAGDCTVLPDGSAWSVHFGDLVLVPEPSVPDSYLSRTDLPTYIRCVPQLGTTG